MANTYPYIASAGPLFKTIEQLRKSFPGELTADTLQKLGLAPENESYIINILKFIKTIDDDGKKIKEACNAFLSDDSGFAKGLEVLVHTAYIDLFELFGEEAWTKSTGDLTTFFRQSDESSAVVGKRQASTFRALAALSGHGDKPQITERAAPSKKKAPKKKVQSKPSSESNNTPIHPPLIPPNNENTVGLTVRIEINLPATDNQEVYDKIFKSIRDNFIDKH